MNGFEKFIEELPSKKKIFSSLTGKKLLIKCLSMFLKFGMYLKLKV